MVAKLKLRLAACALFSFMFAGSATAATAEADNHDQRGLVLSLSCASCHGTDGKSVGIIPGFYGRSSDYIEKALLDFKSGARYSSVMARHAKGYTDEEIHQISQYFGALWQNNK